MSYECIGLNWARAVNSPFAKYKMTSHEGGVCTPMIAHWPAGITRNPGFEDTPGHLVDFMSTFLEVTGGKYPDSFKGKPTKPIEGVSLVPTFSGKEMAPRIVPVGYEFGAGKGIRVGKWKLVRYRNDAWELYDMSVTRTETRNLAGTMPEKVKELQQAYDKWVEGCRAKPAAK